MITGGFWGNTIRHPIQDREPIRTYNCGPLVLYMLNLIDENGYKEVLGLCVPNRGILPWLIIPYLGNYREHPYSMILINYTETNKENIATLITQHLFYMSIVICYDEQSNCKERERQQIPYAMIGLFTTDLTSGHYVIIIYEEDQKCYVIDPHDEMYNKVYNKGATHNKIPLLVYMNTRSYMKLLLFTIIDQTDNFSHYITKSGVIQYVSKDDVIGMLSHDTRVRLNLAHGPSRRTLVTGGRTLQSKKNKTKKNKTKKNKTKKKGFKPLL